VYNDVVFYYLKWYAHYDETNMLVGQNLRWQSFFYIILNLDFFGHVLFLCLFNALYDPILRCFLAVLKQQIFNAVLIHIVHLSTRQFSRRFRVRHNSEIVSIWAKQLGPWQESLCDNTVRSILGQYVPTHCECLLQLLDWERTSPTLNGIQ